MKVISLGLISSIIFTIVLAKNSPDSGSTTGCFGFCRKKPKEAHNTTEESVNVRGKGPYEEDYEEEYEEGYEEDYEDMTKDIFMPLRKCYQQRENRPPKQYDGPPPVPDMPQISESPKKQEMPVEQTVSTVQEEGAATLNRGEEFDVEIDPKVSSYLGDRENDGEGDETQEDCGETQGEVEENQDEYEESQDEYEESQYEYEENQNKYEKIQDEYEETQGEYGETQGEVKE
ncbi:erythrocyte membrane antigen 1 [Plasmodium chabaudi chabaudi]|uniref:Erythrocyte membrane antigen 1 n=1 Tax=Plasmodium chabaudi chabaudi TaxID=31271 RepID=A0A1C6WUA2_PLACU|nr:erythrocyte membrane antigen 1 [Plasmodium chabaudi chabaudi]